MTTTEISNMDDIIDSRDVIARIEELEGERESAFDEWKETTTTEDDPEPFAFDGQDELDALKALATEGEGSPDWPHGETLIRDSYFETYAQELADDIGAIKGTEGWPLNCIDWEKATRELKYDYFTVEFDGVDYWVRL